MWLLKQLNKIKRMTVIKIEGSLESMLALTSQICLFISEVRCLKMHVYYRPEVLFCMEIHNQKIILEKKWFVGKY